jgi:hypothetical protein
MGLILTEFNESVIDELDVENVLRLYRAATTEPLLLEAKLTKLPP